MVWARSEAETEPDPVSSAMKLFRLACALREILLSRFLAELSGRNQCTRQSRQRHGRGF
jgi:hypothetical protein